MLPDQLSMQVGVWVKPGPYGCFREWNVQHFGYSWLQHLFAHLQPVFTFFLVWVKLGETTSLGWLEGFEGLIISLSSEIIEAAFSLSTSQNANDLLVLICMTEGFLGRFFAKRVNFSVERVPIKSTSKINITEWSSHPLYLLVLHLPQVFTFALEKKLTPMTSTLQA